MCQIITVYRLYCKGAESQILPLCCTSNYLSTILHNSFHFVTLSPSSSPSRRKKKPLQANKQSILVPMQAHITSSISLYYAALLRRRGPHIASHSVCLSVCPSVPLSLPWVTSFRQPLASRMYFSARTEGRISYGHLGRTNSCFFFIASAMRAKRAILF